MINPQHHDAIPEPDGLPVKLTYVRDVEAFDGPLVAEFRGDNGETYLYYWCERGDNLNRWAVVRTPQKNLVQYLAGLIPLRDLITKCPDRICYLVDLDQHSRAVNVWYIRVSKLPTNFLPTSDSYRDVDTATDRGYQDVFIGSALADNLGWYQRWYRQASWFTAVLGRNVQQSTDPGISDYRLVGGYSYFNAFQSMHKALPASMKTPVTAISISSPGYIRFAVDPDVASSVRTAILNFQNNRDVIHAMSTELGKWTNGHSELGDDQAKRIIRDLCKPYQVNYARLMRISDKPITAAKALLSFGRRIQFLSEKDRTEEAVMVGLSTTKRSVDSIAVSDGVEVDAGTSGRET